MKYYCSGFLTVYESKVVVEVDSDFGRFYRSLIPKAKKVNGTRYPSHITVIRNENFSVNFEPKEIKFRYSNYIHNNSVYWWVNVQCPELNEFRKSIGLPEWSKLCRPPDGSDNFHITVGNTK